MLLGSIQFIFGMFKIFRYKRNIKSTNIEKKACKEMLLFIDKVCLSKKKIFKKIL